MRVPIVRSFRPPDGSYFLFGPRGTGKTTLLRALHPDAIFVDLLDPAAARELSARPERLTEIVRGARAGVPIVVDEVQRVPELLTVVHALIEYTAACDHRDHSTGPGRSMAPRSRVSSFLSYAPTLRTGTPTRSSRSGARAPV